MFLSGTGSTRRDKSGLDGYPLLLTFCSINVPDRLLTRTIFSPSTSVALFC